MQAAQVKKSLMIYAHTRSLIRAFASGLNIFWALSYLLNSILSFEA